MGALVRSCQLFRFQLIRKLAELVEVDTGPEAERMGLRLGWWGPTRRGRLSQASPNCPVHGFLEGDAELTGPLLEKAGQIVI
jgi:hypothetical protein